MGWSFRDGDVRPGAEQSASAWSLSGPFCSEAGLEVKLDRRSPSRCCLRDLGSTDGTDVKGGGQARKLRRELLNHAIVLSEAHLDRLLREFIEEYYHVARPHQGLAGETPIPTESPPGTDGPTKLVAVRILGGLHHRYHRVAA
jgi:hypothetical protein